MSTTYTAASYSDEAPHVGTSDGRALLLIRGFNGGNDERLARYQEAIDGTRDAAHAENGLKAAESRLTQATQVLRAAEVAVTDRHVAPCGSRAGSGRVRLLAGGPGVRWRPNLDVDRHRPPAGLPHGRGGSVGPVEPTRLHSTLAWHTAGRRAVRARTRTAPLPVLGHGQR